MILKLTIEVKLDDEVYGNSEDEKLWMENEILVGDGTLLLHSNEIGDTIGEVKKVSNVQWLSENGSQRFGYWRCPQLRNFKL